MKEINLLGRSIVISDHLAELRENDKGLKNNPEIFEEYNKILNLMSKALATFYDNDPDNYSDRKWLLSDICYDFYTERKSSVSCGLRAFEVVSDIVKYECDSPELIELANELVRLLLKDLWDRV